MLTAPEVPRLANGGIALCHTCQRRVYFRNGFLPLLAQTVNREAKTYRARRAGDGLDIGALAARANDNLSEDAAYEAFVAARWPDGEPRCPYCATDRTQSISTRRMWRCKGCSKQFSVTTGTVFAGRKLPFANVPSICATLTAGSPNYREAAKSLGVDYRTAWALGKKLANSLSGAA